MKLWEIINPSDPMTMYAPDLLTAGVAVCILGTGTMGAMNVADEAERTPVLFGWREWFVENGANDVEEWIRENTQAVADALGSVALGNAADRLDYDAAIAAIADAKERAEYIKSRNDRLRTSTNDWAGYAHELGKQCAMGELT